MRRMALVAMAVASLTASAAAAPFDGLWSFDREICVHPEGDVLPIEITGDRIASYGASCIMHTITPIGSAGAAWRVAMTCEDEGEKEEMDAVFALHTDPDGKPVTLVEIDMVHGSVVGYYPCARTE
jgi:hypothetical protein